MRLVFAKLDMDGNKLSWEFNTSGLAWRDNVDKTTAELSSDGQSIIGKSINTSPITGGKPVEYGWAANVVKQMGGGNIGEKRIAALSSLSKAEFEKAIIQGGYPERGTIITAAIENTKQLETSPMLVTLKGL